MGGGQLLKFAGCADCDRFWRSYQEALQRYYRLKGKRDTAAMACDSETFHEMSALMEQAYTECAEIQSQLQAHQREVHHFMADDAE